ncbi:carotenoid synthase-carotenoid cyclase-like protein [Dinothrombium tinctorium]|uniref:15-cis-phytoene synthase n=1 Tax=Dinothrombium tinctorium TaxID=1965070 RepID=A0A443QZ93_9ACAR|nr:carotenoid synthase-carotenoid cyclase-like protein [Dinothrombium tinctorium]
MIDTMSSNSLSNKDEEVKNRRRKLHILKRFIREAFNQSSSNTTFDCKNKVDFNSNLYSKINWSIYEKEFAADEIACFRALNRISFLLDSKPFEELLAGYEWDLNGRVPKNMEELVQYTAYVASSVGETCAYFFYNKVVFGYRKMQINGKNFQKMIQCARDCGTVLQLVNIARDIVKDSEELKRCYIPIEFLENAEEELNLLTKKQDPWAIGEEKLRKYALKLIDYSDFLIKKGIEGVRMLPKEVQYPLYAMLILYYEIGDRIKMNPGYAHKVNMSKKTKLWIMLKHIYLRNIFRFILNLN